MSPDIEHNVARFRPSSGCRGPDSRKGGGTRYLLRSHQPLRSGGGGARDPSPPQRRTIYRARASDRPWRRTGCRSSRRTGAVAGCTGGLRCDSPPARGPRARVAGRGQITSSSGQEMTSREAGRMMQKQYGVPVEQIAASLAAQFRSVVAEVIISLWQGIGNGCFQANAAGFFNPAAQYATTQPSGSLLIYLRLFRFAALDLNLDLLGQRLFRHRCGQFEDASVEGGFEVFG